MEEADNILVVSLKHLGINVKGLGDFDSESLIIAIIKCFEKISQMLTEKDNFVDMRFLKS
jgi:hypothetical protein